MSTPDALFKALREPKFSLTVEIKGSTLEDVDTIIESLDWSPPSFSTITDSGNIHFSCISMDELVAEVFRLGVAYNSIQTTHSIADPLGFKYEIVY